MKVNTKYFTLNIMEKMKRERINTNILEKNGFSFAEDGLVLKVN